MELKPGYKQTEVGVIPEGWEVALLDLVAKRGSGHTPDKTHPEYWNGDIKWISLKDSDRLDALYIGDTAAKITPAGIANSSAVVHSAGTVVLSRDAGVGKSAIMTADMAVSQHFMTWLCGPRLNNHFLYYWLQLRKYEFQRIAMGNTIKTIGLPYFRSLRFPLPPLSQQCAIAGALSDVDALIGGLDQLIAKKRDLKQAAMQQLLTGQRRLAGFCGADGHYKQTEVGVVPQDWGRERIGNLASITTGTRNTQDKVEDGKYPFFVRSSTVERINSYSFDGEAVLTAGDGVGTGKVFHYINDKFDLHQRVYRISHFSERLDGYFFYLYFSAHFYDRIMRMTAKSSVDSVRREMIADMRIPLPILSEQKAIAAVLSDMDSEIAALEARRDKTRVLKQGMMQELLTGRIRLV
jgi:type I restriction enzyme S subunit